MLAANWAYRHKGSYSRSYFGALWLIGPFFPSRPKAAKALSYKRSHSVKEKKLAPQKNESGYAVERERMRRRAAAQFRRSAGDLR